MKYLFVLGSFYRDTFDINMPLEIDSDEKWTVYSIDRVSVIESSSTHPNVNVVRMSMDIKTVLEHDIVNIVNSDIYIVDSISCGYITNTSSLLCNHLLERNNNVYFLHYISPHNNDPSINLYEYSDDVLFGAISKLPFNKKATKGLERPPDIFIKKLIDQLKLEKIQSIHKFIERFAILIDLKAERNLAIEELLLNDIKNIVFTQVFKDTELSTLPYKPSCISENIYKLGGNIYYNCIGFVLVLILFVITIIIGRKNKYNPSPIAELLIARLKHFC